MASNSFKKAIDEIDKSIDHLQKTKDALLGTDRSLRLANDKAQDVTIKNADLPKLGDPCLRLTIAPTPEPRMHLGYTILYVPDVPATLKFYESAFGLTTRFLHEGGDYGELDTGSTVLAFSAHKLMQQLGKNPQAASPTAPCFEIALCTPDVAAALERAVAAGATPMRALEVMPWGQTVAYVADINGFLVELCTPMA